MLQALGNNIIVKLVLEEHKGLIEIPKTALKYKQYDGEVFGEVVSVGPKYKYDLNPGDKIIFVRHEGNKFIYEGITYLRLKERWPQAVV
jgi:co-chaperonin GroES (HSP10)